MFASLALLEKNYFFFLNIDHENTMITLKLLMELLENLYNPYTDVVYQSLTESYELVKRISRDTMIDPKNEEIKNLIFDLEGFYKTLNQKLK